MAGRSNFCTWGALSMLHAKCCLFSVLLLTNSHKLSACSIISHWNEDERKLNICSFVRFSSQSPKLTKWKGYTWITNHFVTDRQKWVWKGEQHTEKTDKLLPFDFSKMGWTLKYKSKILKECKTQILSSREVSRQGRKGNPWKAAREIKVKPHTTLISHWKPQTIPGKEETFMLPLSLDVSSLLKCFCILRGGTEFPELSVYSSLGTSGALVLAFKSGSSSTIVSFCWSVSRGISSWDREDK